MPYERRVDEWFDVSKYTRERKQRGERGRRKGGERRGRSIVETKSMGLKCQNAGAQVGVGSGSGIALGS
jgi:hypothetical protein